MVRFETLDEKDGARVPAGREFENPDARVICLDHRAIDARVSSYIVCAG